MKGLMFVKNYRKASLIGNVFIPYDLSPFKKKTISVSFKNPDRTAQ